MIQQVPKPSALAARQRLKQAAPQERICSHSGAPGLGVTREITATTVGARSSRVRSVSSRAADGVSFSSVRHAFRSTRPKVARASPSKTMKRQGSSFLWSGTRAAAVRIVSSCRGAGPRLGQHGRLRRPALSTAARGCPGSWVALRSCHQGSCRAKPSLNQPSREYNGRGLVASADGWHQPCGIRPSGRGRGLVLACAALLAGLPRGERAGAGACVRDRRLRRLGLHGGQYRGHQGQQGRPGAGRSAARASARSAPQTRVGLVAFGHRRGDCGDVELLRPPRAAGCAAHRRHPGEDEPARPGSADDGAARGGQVAAARAGQAQPDPDPRRRRQLSAERVCGRRGAAPRRDRRPRRRPRPEAERRDDDGVPAADHRRAPLQRAHCRADRRQHGGGAATCQQRRSAHRPVRRRCRQRSRPRRRVPRPFPPMGRRGSICAPCWRRRRSR